MRIGLLTDLHDWTPEPAIEKFNNESLDVILVNGDLSNNEVILEGILEAFENARAPVYVIPGNYEPRNAWKRAFQKAPNNVRDASKLKSYEIKGLLFIPYGGADVSPHKDFFYANPSQDYNKLVEIAEKNKNKKMVLQSHIPPKGYGDKARFIKTENGILPLAELRIPGLDQQAVIEHVGDERLKEFVDKYITLATFGHIHENHSFGPRAQRIPDGNPVREGEPVDRLAINPGPYCEGYLAIIEIDDKISYKILNLYNVY